MLKWRDRPVVSLNASAVVIDGVQHVTLRRIAISHSRATAVSALNVSNVLIANCSVGEHGGVGIVITGTESAVRDSEIFEIGCTGVQVRKTKAPGGIASDPNST